LQKRSKIGPETERNEKLCEDVHRADEHVNRIVEERWPATFE
jgi:hypothetical protein